MFDSNEMRELAYLKADRYQRAGGGGAQKVHATSRAYDEAKGYREMSVWAKAVYEASTLWRSDSRSAMSGFRWDCLSHTLDRDGNGDIPF